MMSGRYSTQAWGSCLSAASMSSTGLVMAMASIPVSIPPRKVAALPVGGRERPALAGTPRPLASARDVCCKAQQRPEGQVTVGGKPLRGARTDSAAQRRRRGVCTDLLFADNAGVLLRCVGDILQSTLGDTAEAGLAAASGAVTRALILVEDADCSSACELKSRAAP